MLLNKTMDRADLQRADARSVAAELDELLVWLAQRGLRASSWYGTFDVGGKWGTWERINRGPSYRPLPGAPDDGNFPWFLYWEIAWIVVNTDMQPGQRLLDLGGSSSLFSFYAASKGLEVVTVDLSSELVDNADAVAGQTGWNLTNRVMDMRQLALSGTFDHVTSVCVLEHLPISGRVAVSSQLRQLLRSGGTCSLTFDFANPSRHAQISCAADIEAQIVRRSGLRVRGNREFHDNGKRYLQHPVRHPRAWLSGWKADGVRRGDFGLRDVIATRRRADYTFGALFLENRPDG